MQSTQQLPTTLSGKGKKMRCGPSPTPTPPHPGEPVASEPLISETAVGLNSATPVSAQALRVYGAAQLVVNCYPLFSIFRTSLEKCIISVTKLKAA